MSQKSNTIKDFWHKVEFSLTNECLEWVAAKDKDGYGFFCYKGRQLKAHWRYVRYG